LESGTINSFSIGFQYEWDTIEYNHIDDCYEVYGVKLFEISPVSIPADENTHYMGLKNADDFDKAELELSEQIKESIKKLDINQQREFGELFMLQKSLSRALSASNMKERIKQSTVEKNRDEQPEALFAGIKFNK
jgi:dsDNA-binding SOS-regulon protein